MKQLFTLSLLLGTMGIYAQFDCEHPGDVSPDVTYNVSYEDDSEVPFNNCVGFTGTFFPNKGAWYVYTPAELKTATVSTAAGGTDTRVHIYTGTCGGLMCYDGDDDSGPGATSEVSFTAQAGTTYYIAFENTWNSEDFSFILTETEYVPPAIAFTPQSVSLGGGYQYCVVDLNGDYLDDLVAPSNGSVSVLYQAANDSGFEAATLTAPTTMHMPSWSMAAGDYNKDGYNDLLYGEGSGAAIMLSNSDGTAFSEKLESPQFIFSQRSNFIDIDADGNLDAFVCHDIAPNTYFLNDGEGGFTFHDEGPGVYPEGGNYGSIWIDYDNDGDSDLFIAKCRGGGDPASVDELHRNDGGGVFVNVAEEAGFADMHQSWSSAWADFDNDGDMDVMVGNSAGAFGEFDPENPLHNHKLMKNNGDGTFSNVTVGSGYDEFTTANLEHVAHDFDNDGYVDILGGGNTIMHNNGDWTFSPVEEAPSSGPVGDLNNDGFLDIQNGNTVYFNMANSNNWIKIHLEGIESNRNGIGARVEVYTATEGLEKQIRDIRSGDGFRYMSSLNGHFGIGEAEEIEKVVVKWPSGTVDTILNPDINEALLVVEGEHILGNEEFAASTFTLYPNPAREFLSISGMETGDTADIYDLGGKLVKSAEVTDNTVPVQSLAKGTYIIMIKDAEGKQHSAKFIKG